MELIHVTTILYAEDMVSFTMLERGILWKPPWPPHRLRESVKIRCSKLVAKLMAALARDTEKDNLAETGPVVLQRVTSYDQFERFSREFARLYFEKYRCTNLSILTVCTYITEFSAMYHLRDCRMYEAPQVAIGVIFDILMQTTVGTFIGVGGLNSLNRTAMHMIHEVDPGVLV